jgi:hypothetical protein
VPNVPDHGFAGGNEDGAETNMAAEDAEFLEAMLRRLRKIHQCSS